MTKPIKTKGRVERFALNYMTSSYGAPGLLAKSIGLPEADVIDALERGFDESPFATVRAILDALHMNMHYGMDGLVFGAHDLDALKESIEQLEQQRRRLDNLIGDAETLEDAKGAWEIRNTVGRGLACLKKWATYAPKPGLIAEEG